MSKNFFFNWLDTGSTVKRKKETKVTLLYQVLIKFGIDDGSGEV